MPMSTRLELRINEDLAQDLENFARKSSTSKTEIIRRAMTLYALARAENENGRKIGFLTPDGKVEREVVAL